MRLDIHRGMVGADNVKGNKVIKPGQDVCARPWTGLFTPALASSLHHGSWVSLDMP